MGEVTEDELVGSLHQKMRALSPQERVALCSPDISPFGQHRPAEYSSEPPPEHGALDLEDTLANRVVVQPVAILQGAPDGASAQVVKRLRRLRFTAEYFGLRSAPICLELVAPATGSDSECKGLVGAGGSIPALEFSLCALHDGEADGGGEVAIGPGSELLRYLRTWPLQVDVWDGDSGFALGTVALPGLACIARQGREAVYYYDVCSFLTPLAVVEGSEAGGLEAPLAGSADMKEVQLRGLESGASIAFRVVCIADEVRPALSPAIAGGSGGILLSSPSKVCGGIRVPLKRRNAAEGAAAQSDESAGAAGKPGSRGYLDQMLKHAEAGGGGVAGWHRARPDQSALPQRAALALVYVNQHRVLEALRMSAQREAVGLVEARARGEGRAGAALAHRRWSDLPLTADALTAPLAPLGLDALHLHAFCLSLQAAAAEAAQQTVEEGRSSSNVVVVDLQRLLLDSRYSPCLEMAGEAAIGKMDAIDVKARRAMQRLMRDLLAAMAGHSLASMRNPVGLFARVAPSGTLTANGFRELCATLQVAASESVVYAGWRAMCQDSNSHDGVDVTTFLRFFRVKAVAHKQPCSFEVLGSLQSDKAGPPASRVGGAGGVGDRLHGSADTQKELLKDLLHGSHLWLAYRDCCAEVRRLQQDGSAQAQVQSGPGGADTPGGVGASAHRQPEQERQGDTSVVAAAGNAAPAPPAGKQAALAPQTSTAANSSGAGVAADESGAAGAKAGTAQGMASAGETLKKGMDRGGQAQKKGSNAGERHGKDEVRDAIKSRDKALKALVKELMPLVAGVDQHEMVRWLEALEAAQTADRRRKAARLRAVLHPVKPEEGGAATAAGMRGGEHAADAATVEASGLAGGVQGRTDGAGGAGGQGEQVANGAGDDRIDNRRQGRDGDVRRALESRGWLLDISRGGGWAPARIAVQVVVGSPAARARCPVTNPSDQPLCFEVIVQRAADDGKAAGTVRIDHGDEELQLLQSFNLCQFVEEETRPQEPGANGDTGLDEGVMDASASLGGAVAIRLLLQPRARVEVPLVFFRGNMLPGSTSEKPVLIRMRRACGDQAGRETFNGAVLLEEKLLVSASVLPPTSHQTVRLFVRDFNARFAAGSTFVIRKTLRFPCHDSGSRAAGQAARLEEMWLSLVASRMVAKGVEEGSATMSFKGSSSPGGGSRRLLNGSSFKSAGSGLESEVVVDGDVMRYEGRRWKRVPGQSLRDRLVTEPLPVVHAPLPEQSFVRYFCTSLLAHPPHGRRSGGGKNSEWIEQWGGENTGRAVAPISLPRVERQWVWEIRSVSHMIVQVPPQPPRAVASVSDIAGLAAAAPIADASGADGNDKVVGQAGCEATGAHDQSQDKLGGEDTGDTLWDKADTFTVAVAMQRPWSLWGDSARCRLHTTAPAGVRFKGGASVVTRDDKAEMQIQVNRAHDDSPVYLHLVDDDGHVSGAWLLSFAQSSVKTKLTPCGMRVSLEELRFSRKGTILLPQRGGRQTMEMNELKDHLRTDIALTMGCDPARVQLLKVEPRQVLSHGPALEVFHELDADGSGVLERSELKKAIRRLSVHGVMIEDVDALLEILDPSGDGKVTFDEFVAALDAGLEVHLIVMPAHKKDGDDDEGLGQGTSGAAMSPLDLAEKLFEFAAGSPYGSSRGAGDSALVGLLRFCGEVEILPTSRRIVRGQDRQEAAACAIQKRVRGMQSRAQLPSKTGRLAQNQELIGQKLLHLQEAGRENVIMIQISKPGRAWHESYTILDKPGNARKQRSAKGVARSQKSDSDLDKDEGQVSDGEEEEETEALGEHGAAASDPALAAGESGQGHRPVQPQPPDGVGRVEQQPEQDAIASAGYGADDGAPAAKTRKTQAQAPEIVVGAEEADDGAEGAERAESIVSKSPTQSTASVAVEAVAGPWEQERQQEPRRRVRVGGTDNEMDEDDEALDVSDLSASSGDADVEREQPRAQAHSEGEVVEERSRGRRAEETQAEEEEAAEGASEVTDSEDDVPETTASGGAAERAAGAAEAAEAEVKSYDEDKVIKMQARARGRHAREQARKDKDKIVKLQARVRGNRGRKAAKAMARKGDVQGEDGRASPKTVSEESSKPPAEQKLGEEEGPGQGLEAKRERKGGGDETLAEDEEEGAEEVSDSSDDGGEETKGS